MGAAISLIPELEEVVQHGSRHRRAETLRRVTALFLDGATSYNDAHVELFDDVFAVLIDEIEDQARAELAHHLAPIDNAPIKVLRMLAGDDDIAVAGPVLKLAPRLAEADLVEFAQTKSQAHLQAISTRRALGEAVTDVLVRRGDRDVVRSMAGNRNARISETGFVRLVKRAESDGLLAETVGARSDIPPRLLGELLTKATAIVQKRLLTSATAEQKTEIRRVLEKVSKEVGARVGARDYRAAQRVVLGLRRVGGLDEAALAAFANDGKFEESVVALSALSQVPVSVVDRLMTSERPDPVLILCKAVGMSWPTAKSVIMVRPDGKPPSTHGVDSAFANFGRLSVSTAKRVVKFWQIRQNM